MDVSAVSDRGVKQVLHACQGIKIIQTIFLEKAK